MTDVDIMRLSRSTTCLDSGWDWTEMRPHLLTLYSLARHVCWPNPEQPQPATPPLCVEIGVREGVSTLALLYAMSETNGRLISIDIDDVATEKARRNVDKYELGQWWDLRIANSGEVALTWTDPIDLLFIDGDHALAGVRADIANYLPHLRPSGVALLHDYYADIGCVFKSDGVAVVVDELDRAAYDVVTLPWAYGLTVVRAR